MKRLKALGVRILPCVIRKLYQIRSSTLAYCLLGATSEPQPLFAEQYKTFDPQVMNLLVTIVYASIGHASLRNLPDCPFNSLVVRDILDKLPTFTTAYDTFYSNDHITCEKGRVLLNWICENYGSMIKLAPSHLTIPQFPTTVQQYIVQKPPRHGDFSRALKAENGQSTLLFHGTNLRYLVSILQNGFKSSYDHRFGKGNFMAEEPATSCRYANDDCYYRKPRYWWRNSPVKGGVLLGCQVAGKGEPVPLYAGEEPGVHVVTDLSSIEIRYIFVVEHGSPTF